MYDENLYTVQFICCKHKISSWIIMKICTLQFIFKGCIIKICILYIQFICCNNKILSWKFVHCICCSDRILSWIFVHCICFKNCIMKICTETLLILESIIFSVLLLVCLFVVFYCLMFFFTSLNFLYDVKIRDKLHAQTM